MNLGAVLGGLVKGRVRRQGRIAFAFAAAATGFRVFRRFTRASNKPAIRFAVKPGEVYEIRGVTRGK
ncbi:MAG: hypothetical protein ACXVJ7_18095 [Acidimicrobiia bacterium]